MIELWFTYRQAKKIAEIAEASGRAKVEILRLAVGHWKANPKRYAHITCPARSKRKHRLCLRISRELRMTLAEDAWNNQMRRATWLTGLVIRMLQIVRKRNIIGFLAGGRDLCQKLEEIVLCPKNTSNG